MKTSRKKLNHLLTYVIPNQFDFISFVEHKKCILKSIGNIKGHFFTDYEHTVRLNVRVLLGTVVRDFIDWIIFYFLKHGSQHTDLYCGYIMALVNLKRSRGVCSQR